MSRLGCGIGVSPPMARESILGSAVFKRGVLSIRSEPAARRIELGIGRAIIVKVAVKGLLRRICHGRMRARCGGKALHFSLRRTPTYTVCRRPLEPRAASECTRPLEPMKPQHVQVYLQTRILGSLEESRRPSLHHISQRCCTAVDLRLAGTSRFLDRHRTLSIELLSSGGVDEASSSQAACKRKHVQTKEM